MAQRQPNEEGILLSSLISLAKGSMTGDECVTRIKGLMLPYFEVYELPHNIKNAVIVLKMILEAIWPGSFIGIGYALNGKPLSSEVHDSPREEYYLERVIGCLKRSLNTVHPPKLIAEGASLLDKHLDKILPMPRHEIER